MPGGDGAEQGDGRWAGTASASSRRATICVSSQVGCAVNCQFCLTAKLGLQRNLSAGEIAGQVIAVLDRQAVQVGRDRINLVFMGMGEPFLNYDEFMAAVRLLVNEAGLAESRMTVSTSGIVPGILRLAAETVRPRLAISLNAPNDGIREAIMPITRKWKIEEVIQAAGQLPLRPRERVTFEYVLLGGVNDGLRACGRISSAGAQCAHAGEGEPDCLESRSWDWLRDAGAGAGSGLSAKAHRARRSRLSAPAAGQRHLRRLRPAQANGRQGEFNRLRCSVGQFWGMTCLLNRVVSPA